MISGGLVLIIAGILIWLSKIGIYTWSWRRDWPLILVIIGILSIVSHLEGKKAFHVEIKHKKKEE